MLYVALVLSAFILLVSNLSMRSGSSRFLGVLMACGMAAGAASILFHLVPVVLWQALFTVVAGAVFSFFPSRPRRFLLVSFGAALLAYVIAGGVILQQHFRYAEWREQYPFESIEGRVPLLPPTSVPPTDVRGECTDRLEGHLDDEYRTMFRSRKLERIHEKAVDEFVNSWGFGIGRFRKSVPTEHGLKYGLRTEPAPQQPANPSYPPEAVPAGTCYPAKPDLEYLHHDGVVDFVHPAGFGYVRDRGHVAGFQSHRFSKVPEAEDWEVARLELVSLLMHKEPGVYVSDRLPQMDALKGVPTRPLDDFEKAGLAALRKGDDLYLREDRLLGSVRGVNQCIACHGGERGQLLGAFSYTLRPAKK